MKINYKIPTKSVYLEYSDENEIECKEIYFEPSNEELSECLARCIYDEYFEVGMFEMADHADLLQYIKEFITDKELINVLAENSYYDEVVNWFKKDALGR